MVFRKPYGFLIKYFKLIHLILTGLYIYLAFKVNGIFQYYDEFSSGIASKLDAISYVNDYYIIAIVLSIIICLVVYGVMRYKDKPRLFYLVLMVLYLGVAVMINVSYGGLQTIYISVLETKTVRLYRDLLQIMLWIQYLSIIVVLIRGLGFDIKKFNFVKDLQELNLDVSDEEEVELTLGGTETAQRKVHRGFREFKYYYLENKIFIHIILVVLVVIGFCVFTVEREVINKKYQEGEVFSSNDFSFQVLNTFITTRDYQGTMIGNLDHCFVVVRMMVQSNVGKKSLNTANLILKVNHNSYVSEVRYAERFIDLGNVYQGQFIQGNSTYLFLFPVLKDDLGNDMELIYLEEKTVSLEPIDLDVVGKPKVYGLGDKIDLSKSAMNNGYLVIKSYDLKDKFNYSYQYEISGKKYTSELTIVSGVNAILHLKIDSSYRGIFDDYDILSKYAKLKYKVGENEYSSIVFNDKTPGDYKDGLYVAVDKKLMQASNIWFEINIRNQKYLYTIL